jgi:hypothetical protein
MVRSTSQIFIDAFLSRFRQRRLRRILFVWSLSSLLWTHSISSVTDAVHADAPPTGCWARVTGVDIKGFAKLIGYLYNVSRRGGTTKHIFSDISPH